MSFLPDQESGRPSGKRRGLAREPVITVSAITALVIALCVLLREFGVPISPGQQAAISVVVGLLFPLAAGFLARWLVTPLADPRDSDGHPLTPEDSTGFDKHHQI